MKICVEKRYHIELLQREAEQLGGILAKAGKGANHWSTEEMETGALLADLLDAVMTRDASRVHTPEHTS